MKYDSQRDIVTIFDKDTKLDTVVAKLCDLSASQMKDLFSSRGIKIPRAINCLALKLVLNERIKTLNSLSMNKEMFTKLKYYSYFGEFHLQQLFTKICNDEDFIAYKIELWRLIIKNCFVLGLTDADLKRFINSKKIGYNGFEEYQKNLNDFSMDLNKQFDGISIKQLDYVLNNIFSLDDLRGICAKYGYDIPARLKKEVFVDYVKQILKSKRKLTIALGKEIDEMTIVQLNSLCKVHEIELSANLKRNELVYLLKFLIKKDELTVSDLDVIDSFNIKPIEFIVDINAVDNFGRGEEKKVIYFNEQPEEVKTKTSNNKNLTPKEILELARKRIEQKKAQSNSNTIESQDKYDDIENLKKLAKVKAIERLALARKRKKELEEQRILEEQSLKENLEPTIEEEKNELEENFEVNESNFESVNEIEEINESDDFEEEFIYEETNQSELNEDNNTFNSNETVIPEEESAGESEDNIVIETDDSSEDKLSFDESNISYEKIADDNNEATENLVDETELANDITDVQNDNEIVDIQNETEDIQQLASSNSTFKLPDSTFDESFIHALAVDLDIVNNDIVNPYYKSDKVLLKTRSIVVTSLIIIIGIILVLLSFVALYLLK